MANKKKIVYKGETIRVAEYTGYWVVEFPDGSSDKLYYHINAEKNAIWMWESGKIDDASLSIGRLIDGLDGPITN